MWGPLLQGSGLLSRSLAGLGSGCTLHPHLHQERKNHVSSPSRAAQTTGFPLTSTPHPDLSSLLHPPQTQETLAGTKAPWVLPVLHPLGISEQDSSVLHQLLGNTGPGQANQGLHPPGSGVDRRPKQTYPDLLPECFLALLPRVAEPQDGAPG